MVMSRTFEISMVEDHTVNTSSVHFFVDKCLPGLAGYWMVFLQLSTKPRYSYRCMPQKKKYFDILKIFFLLKWITQRFIYLPFKQDTFLQYAYRNIDIILYLLLHIQYVFSFLMGEKAPANSHVRYL